MNIDEIDEILPESEDISIEKLTKELENTSYLRKLRSLSEIVHGLSYGLLNNQVRKVFHNSNKQMVCCCRQLLNYTESSQYLQE